MEFEELPAKGVKYQIAVQSGKWKKKFGTSTSPKTVKFLYSKKRKKLSVSVRAYVKIGGKTYYGKWAKAKAVKARKH